MILCTNFLFSSPSERTADDLEIIYEELLHIKALSHLSTTVSTGSLSYVVTGITPLCRDSSHFRNLKTQTRFSLRLIPVLQVKSSIY